MLLDDASAELKALRAETATLRERVLGRLQDVIERHADLLSDRYYTLREGRYVLPVRRDAHDRLPGIVHGASASGASIFVEPRAVVVHGNRLKMLEAEREREELRILGALSDLTRERLPALREAAAALDRLDLRSAAALLGRDLGGSVPEISDRPAAKLIAARHPLLVLDGIAVVANDIALDAGHGIVISGPNAGGKTVVLKTLGLCALMLRCGLPLPAAEGSALGFFASVLSEMGDEQSTATNLSTFSAHVRNLVRLLERTGPGSLVLLDEVATGTDPAEGAGLACALVDAFCARGAALAASTHYEALKAMSLRDSRLRSASVGFDYETMTPTFHLRMDVPGASSALAVARRFGLPNEVIAAAERFIPEQARDFELLVRTLTERAARLEQERAELSTEKRALEIQRREQEQRAEALRERSKHKLSAEAEQLMAELRSARSELDQARSALKRDERSAQALDEARNKIRKAAESVGIGSGVMAAIAPEPSPAAAPRAQVAQVTVGDRVYVPRLRSDASVVETSAKGKVLVAVGAMKLWVEADELRGGANEAATASRPLPAAAAAEDAHDHVLRSHDNTVDVRGLRAEDALGMVESFIDRLYAGPARVGYVLHGHGTGALRAAIREHLERDLPYVERIRPGDGPEGGDAVTVFYLS
jgi:DNA mismatch repair protein MutS2